MIRECAGFEDVRETLDFYSRNLKSLQGNCDFFAHKLFSYGRVIEYVDGLDRIGFAAFYANDLDTKTAFISFLAVDKQFRKRGGGTLLLSEICCACISLGMEKIRLEVNLENSAAIQLYRKKGFVFENNPHNNCDFMVKNLLKGNV